MVGSGSSRFVSLSRETILATNGLVALARLATESADVAKLARSAGASVREMRSVMGRLRRAGLIEAGSNGSAGFRLARQANAMSLYDVASAVGEDFRFCRCAPPRESTEADCVTCVLEGVSERVRADVISLLKSKTVAQLATPSA